MARVCPPHLDSHIRTTEGPAQRGEGQRGRAPKRMVPPGAAKGIREAGARNPWPGVLTKELQ